MATRTKAITWSLVLVALFVFSGMGYSAEFDRVRIRAGFYRPLFKENTFSRPSQKVNRDPKSKPKRIAVGGFEMDRYPVTNARYLEFVKSHPEWRRSQVKPIFAEKLYLSHWKSDLDFGDAKVANSPVNFVSWFAANAYCEWRGEDLPTVDEWEYAAAPKEGDRQAQKLYRKILLGWYQKPTPQELPPVGSTFKNHFGIYDLHGLIWEWTSDFNSTMIEQDARAGGGPDTNLFCGGGSANANDFNDYAGFMRYAFRSSLKGDFTVANLGFRCIKRQIK